MRRLRSAGTTNKKNEREREREKERERGVRRGGRVKIRRRGL